MDKIFDSYWVLRITALVLALLLFFYVKAQMDEGHTTSSNPQMDIITDVPLEAYYDSENLIVSGLPKTVDVRIEGPMQIVLQTKLTKDFKVFVDLNSLPIGEHRVTIQHENFSPKLEVSIDPKVVDISIEEKVTEEVRIEPEINNSLIAEGFELTSMTADPGTVFVTGAKSVIENISYVKATVSGEEGLNASFEQNAAVKVLDSNLNKLDVTIEPETVKVNVNIRQYSREIPLKIQPRGTPLEGVTVRDLKSDTKSVIVYGPKSIIDSLTELVVEFDVSEIEESGTYKVDLVVPNGATRLSKKSIDIDANVTRETQTNAETSQPEDNVEDTQETDSNIDTNTDTDISNTETVEEGTTEQ